MKRLLLSTTSLNSLGMIPAPFVPYRDNENAADEVHMKEKRVVYNHPVPLQAFLHWISHRFAVEIKL